ncbi:hypothetical protein, partial [Desulfobulbus alkaliphilus]|uniref:hypothetical protein n=1 Tax=Desulfobulbus alkaliphilus TaxID=869814 RepID=UPI0019649D60
AKPGDFLGELNHELKSQPLFLVKRSPVVVNNYLKRKLEPVSGRVCFYLYPLTLGKIMWHVYFFN